MTESQSNLDQLNTATQAAEIVARESGVSRHEIGLIVGSGWGLVSDYLGEISADIPAEVLPGFGQTTVPGHSGRVKSVQTAQGKQVLVIGARTHLYENRGVPAVVHPVRTAFACGAKVLILTNASGGITESTVPGRPVLIADHLNLTGTSPLEGANFVDMSEGYSKRLRELAKRIDPTLEEGVYAQFRGPQYETPAEVKMAKLMGAHMVGMSTALEAIQAKALGLEILGLSLITNLAAGISERPLSHREVVGTGEAAGPTLAKLLSGIVHAI